jgi:hypothetical protein
MKVAVILLAKHFETQDVPVPEPAPAELHI